MYSWARLELSERISHDSRLTNHVWFILHFPHGRLSLMMLLLLLNTRCHTYPPHLSSALAAGGGENIYIYIYREVADFSQQTLSTSVRCVTKHLKSLQLVCEVTTARRSEVMWQVVAGASSRSDVAYVSLYSYHTLLVPVADISCHLSNKIRVSHRMCGSPPRSLKL